MSMLYYIIYQSTPAGEVNAKVIQKITEQSIKWNVKSGVTGVLIYHDGQYLQYLEGEEDSVNQIFDKIRNDPRHHQVVRKIIGYTNERIFSEWSMGSWTLEKYVPEEFKALKDLNEYMADPLNSEFESAKYIGMMRNILNQWIKEDEDHANRLKKTGLG